MGVYLNELRHPLIFYFGDRQEDGLGGWTWGPSTKVKVWASVKPIKAASDAKQTQAFIKRAGRGIQARGRRYEIVVRGEEVSQHLSQLILGIVWGKHRLIATSELQSLDEAPHYMGIQAALPLGLSAKGEA